LIHTHLFGLLVITSTITRYPKKTPMAAGLCGGLAETLRGGVIAIVTELDGTIYRKSLYLVVKTLVSGWHFPLNQLPLLGTNPPRCADDRILIGYTSGSFTLVNKLFGRNTIWDDVLNCWKIPRNLGLALTALPPGLDGLSRFIVHGIDLVQRIDIQLLGKQSPWNLTPRWMVEGFFWAQLSPADFDFFLQRCGLEISPVIEYLWIPWVDIETDISAAPISRRERERILRNM
jgi:hypothetical protein